LPIKPPQRLSAVDIADAAQASEDVVVDEISYDSDIVVCLYMLFGPNM
jgi:hypothetical protein